MQFGFGAPVNGPLSGPRDLARIVSEGEAIGYDYCAIGDQVMIPQDMENKYPIPIPANFPAAAAAPRTSNYPASPLSRGRHRNCSW